MNVDRPAQIRNLAVVGHNQTGKTSLVAALLHTSGATNRLLSVGDGNTVTDFDHEEIERKISIGAAAAFAPWNDHKVNLVDCPGYGIFFTETAAAMRATDVALVLLDAVAGVEVVTERVWQESSEIGQPTWFHCNKMDRERADFEATVAALAERFDRAVLPLQLPIGAESGFTGVIDLLSRTAHTFTRGGDGKGSSGPVPAELADAAEEARNKLIEQVAESDDELLEHFFEEGTLDDDQLLSGLRRAIANRKIFPVTCGDALHQVGTSALLDLLVAVAPDPLSRPAFVAADGSEIASTADGPVAAIVFKTLSDPFSGKISILRVLRGTIGGDATLVNSNRDESERLGHLLHLQGKQGTQTSQLVTGDIAGVAKLKVTQTGDTLCDKSAPVQLGWLEIRPPAMSFAIEPKSKGDEDKIGDALHRLIEEDPSLSSGRDAQTGELLLSGTGQLHVEIAVAKMKFRSKVEVVLHQPKVPYRETIKKPADGHGRHKKQTGGRGQFADCKIRIEPLPRGGDFEFVDEIFGGSIPQGFRPAVEKGIQESRRRGYLAGYPVVDFRVRLLDGQYHDVDSSEMAFKIAGSMGFKEAMAKAAPTLLEPVMKVQVTSPEEYTGDIMGDLSQRRGRPSGMDTRSGQTIIDALVPLAEMLTYAPALRSMTQGRASFQMEMIGYEEVPKMVQDKIIAEAKHQLEDEDEH